MAILDTILVFRPFSWLKFASVLSLPISHSEPHAFIPFSSSSSSSSSSLSFTPSFGIQRWVFQFGLCLFSIRLVNFKNSDFVSFLSVLHGRFLSVAPSAFLFPFFPSFSHPLILYSFFCPSLMMREWLLSKCETNSPDVFSGSTLVAFGLSSTPPFLAWMAQTHNFLDLQRQRWVFSVFSQTLLWHHRFTLTQLYWRTIEFYRKFTFFCVFRV